MARSHAVLTRAAVVVVVAGRVDGRARVALGRERVAAGPRRSHLGAAVAGVESVGA